MERIGWVFLTVALAAFCASNSAKAFSAPPREHADNRVLYGPDGFSFCGGSVEIWVQAGSYNTQLFLKASPPKGAVWKIWNAHVVVPVPITPNQPVRFANEDSVTVPGSRTNVLSLTLPGPSSLFSEGLSVALRPFEGCSVPQAEKGVKLTPSL